MAVLSFKLATVDDDAALRARMKEDALPGNITVSFRREPSFFYGSYVQGDVPQIIKCLDTQSGRLVGLGSRIISQVYVNGQAQRVGYLADLRAHSKYRGSTALARGYRYLRQLHLQDSVPLYYSMILQDNHVARNILTSARCGLPCYRDIGRFLTPAVYLDFPKKMVNIDGVSFRRASDVDLNAIFSFIQRCASEKQLAPVLKLGDYGTDRLRDLNVNDFYLAVQDTEIVGIIAAWDQGAFRQTHVERYSMSLGMMRPFYNSISKFTSLKPLPAPGSHVPYFYLAFVSIKNNEPEIFRGLLRYLYNHRRTGPWSYFIAGLHEKDPLSRVLFEYRRIDVSGQLYVVHYPENQPEYEQFDNRIPYVEIAMI
jgi:hypothetical protein